MLRNKNSVNVSHRNEEAPLGRLRQAPGLRHARVQSVDVATSLRWKTVRRTSCTRRRSLRHLRHRKVGFKASPKTTLRHTPISTDSRVPILGIRGGAATLQELLSDSRPAKRWLESRGRDAALRTPRRLEETRQPGRHEGHPEGTNRRQSSSYSKETKSQAVFRRVWYILLSMG